MLIRTFPAADRRLRPGWDLGAGPTLTAFCAAVVCSVSVFTGAVAQDRSPAARETLADLAYTLGQAHALRIRCEGEEDQVWRARMMRLVELEQPDKAFRDQLFESFNTGFLGAQASHPRCTGAARVEAARVAARGRDLAGSLARR